MENEEKKRAKFSKLASVGESALRGGTKGLGRLMPTGGIRHPDSIVTTNPRLRNLYVHPNPKAPDGGSPPKDPMELYFGRKKRGRR